MPTDMNIHNTNKLMLSQKKFEWGYIIYLRVEGKDETHTLKIFSKDEMVLQCEEGMSITKNGITLNTIARLEEE